MRHIFTAIRKPLALIFLITESSLLLNAGTAFPPPRAARLAQSRASFSAQSSPMAAQQGQTGPAAADFASGGPDTVVSASWPGIPTDFTLEPPDPSGAAGPNGILAAVNLRVAYYDKTGRAIWGPIGHDVFFASDGINGNNLLSDPHTVFDRNSGRFYTVLLEVDLGASKSYLNIAVSKTANPATSGTSDWFFYRIEDTEVNGAMSAWTDYPGLGVDGQAVYVTYNMYTFPFSSATYTNATIIVLDKAALNTGTTNYAFLYNNGFTLQPCTVLGSSSPGNVAYFAETPIGDSSHVRIWALSDPLGARTLTSTILNTTDNGGFPPFSGAPQPVTFVTLDPSDGRTQGNAFWINGSIWFCTTAGGSSGRSMAYYYRVDLNSYPSGTPSLGEEGAIDGGPGIWTFQPSIGGNALGDVAIVYSQSSLTLNPSIYVTSRKAGAIFFDVPSLVKTSPAYYFGGRWGDFASVTSDPVDESFWITHEWARSAQLGDWGTWWANVTPKIAPFFLTPTNYVSGGNGNGVIDFNECNSLAVVLTNVGSLGATNLQATLSSATPDVFVTQTKSGYPNLPVGSAGTNFTAFKVSTSPSFVCGTPIFFTLVVKSDQATLTNTFTLATGIAGATTKLSSGPAVPIPDADPIGAYSPIVISNITSAISKLSVSLFITHTFDQDLTISLISPAGVTNILSSHNGFNGANYGGSCAPDTQRTTFDDSATTPIGNGAPPYIGSFVPQESLSVFNGINGTNVNGTWLLHVVDDAQIDVGMIQCWSLNLLAAQCTDGGGECPGSDLAIGMVSTPEPLMLGGNLTYTISVTNNGPSSAKNVAVTHVLPSNVVFQSVTVSQGGYTLSGGVLSCNLGTLNARGRATITVIVLPTVAATLSSIATVTSDQNDFEPSNNSVTVFSHVNPPTSDMAVGLQAAPEPVILGGTVTYTMSVTNNGPSPASGVTVTNVLPASMAITSANASQGSLSIFGNVVVCNLGSLAAGAHASAVIVATATTEGTFVASSSVTANQLDPLSPNNTASATSTVGPAADLAISISDSPDPVVVRSNLTYQIVVTNRGPSTATGVTLSGNLPPGVTLVSSNTTQGIITINGSSVNVDIGTLNNNAAVTVTLKVFATVNGTITFSAAVTGNQTDQNPANNSASATTLVSAPFVSVIASGATLTSESISPTNGAVDLGETVTVNLRLRNTGNVNTTNLVATLLTTNGVTPVGPNSPQTYGVLQASGLPVGRSFSFTASGTNGGSVVAVLQLHDGASSLGTVSFNFGLPNVLTFSNTSAITIRDNTSASPYPSSLNVSGVTGVLGKVVVTLNNLSHTFPQDVDVLVVAPAGQKSILMSGAGAPPVDHSNVSFDDTAAGFIPDGSAQIATGTYKPAAYVSGFDLPSPAPTGPYPAAMSSFNAASPNGTWSLYANDHTAGDVGTIAGGWSVALTMISPVNQLADLSITGIAAPAPGTAGSNLTNTFTITNAGPNNASFVTFSDPLPPNVTLISASAGQGVVVTNASSATVNLGPLAAGASTTVTIVLSPSALAAGQMTNTASVSGSEIDLNLANNSVAMFSTINLPVSDLSLSQIVPLTPVVIGTTFASVLNITNNGPGNALNVVLSDTVPTNRLGFVSLYALGRPYTYSNGVVTANLGTLAPGATVSITLVFNALSLGQATNAPVLSFSSTDNNLANNTASAVISIVNPSPSIVPAGASLLSESGPANGTIDNGETVTVSLALTNNGSADTTNLVATLLSSGGVTPSGSPQTYGVVIHGGATVARSFTFTANGVSGGIVTASLQLSDGAASLGTVPFVFHLPGVTSYTNSVAITIPDHGLGIPYPSSITVSGLTGVVSKVRATLRNVSHSFPRDINALLVNPSGAAAVLVSHSGGGHAITNVTLTFDDSAAGGLSVSDALTSGTYRASAYGTTPAFSSPAPSGLPHTTLAALNGSSPNGTWSLYVLDDSVGDAGSIAAGWSLDITSVSTVSPVADLAVGLASAPATVFTSSLYTNTISVTNFGPTDATGVVLSNVLPTGLSFVGMTQSQGSYSGPTAGVITWNLGSLASGASAQASVVVSPTVSGVITNLIGVRANQTDLNTLDNTQFTLTSTLIPIPAHLAASILAGKLELTINAQAGLTYIIQASTNLTTWTSISTNSPTSSGVIKFSDPTTPPLKARYYRTVRVLP
jgi:uncharacterized repeat protein (TIGR01451 family)